MTVSLLKVLKSSSEVYVCMLLCPLLFEKYCLEMSALSDRHVNKNKMQFCVCLSQRADPAASRPGQSDRTGREG